MSEKKEALEMTVGEMLANARTNGRRKRDLATIARQLCIREEFLDALEKGNYHQIPELVYILGFTRNYALEVGLDPDFIVAKIKKELGLTHEGEGLKDVPKGDDSAKAVPVKKKELHSGRMLKNTTLTLRRHGKWLAGAVVLIAILIIVAVLAAPGEKAGVATPEIASDAVQTARAEPNYRIAVKESFGTGTPATRIILQATAETWLKIEDTKGETLFSRVLTAGDVYYVPTGGAIATVGNAGGLDVWVDGRPASKLGADGAKRSDIVLAPDALAGE
jgi:cytoskeleton protein RodZ